MSFSGGTFSINTSGQPVVSGTTISASVFNALTADLATGLSTCMLKDGTQTATAGIGFFAGTVSLPGIYFGTDTATGFYRIGLNNNGYAVNGTKLLDMTGTTLAITSTVTANTIGVTSGTTATVFNTTATTVNAFGAASVALNIGHASGTNTVLGATTFSQAGTFSSTLTVNDVVLINTSTILSGRILQIANDDTNDTVVFQSNGASTATPLLLWNTSTSGDNYFSSFYTEGSITLRGSITYNRGGGVVAYNTTSDYRAKTLFGKFVGSGELIDSVSVHFGVMNGAKIKRPMFVAHELQSAAAWAVTGEKDAVDADGNPIFQQVDHQVLVPALWSEIKSLRSRVFALENA